MLSSDSQQSAYFPLRINNSQATQQVVPLQFPSTRNILWEGRPVGDPEILSLISTTQDVQLFIVEKSLRLAHRYCDGKQVTSFLLGTVYPKSDQGGICLGVDRFDPGREVTDKIDDHISKYKVPTAVVPGDHVIPIKIKNELLAVQDYTSHTKDEFGRAIQTITSKICGKDSLSLSHVMSLKTNIYCSKEENELTLNLCCGALVPDVTFQAVPIAPLPIIPTALARNLAGPLRLSDVQGTPKMGYITMDQTRKLLLLLESDPKIYGLPLIGIWISGVHSVHHPFVWASCLRYLNCSEIKDRVLHRNGSFLLLHYSIVQRMPDFWECSSQNTDVLDITLLSCQEQLVIDLDLSCAKDPLCFSLSPAVEGTNKMLFDEAKNEWNSERSNKAAHQHVSSKPSSGGVHDEQPRPSPSPHPSPTQGKASVPPVPEDLLSVSMDEVSPIVTQHVFENNKEFERPVLAPRFDVPARHVTSPRDAGTRVGPTRPPLKPITQMSQNFGQGRSSSRERAVKSTTSSRQQRMSLENKENTPVLPKTQAKPFRKAIDKSPMDKTGIQSKHQEYVNNATPRSTRSTTTSPKLLSNNLHNHSINNENAQPVKTGRSSNGGNRQRSVNDSDTRASRLPQQSIPKADFDRQQNNGSKTDMHHQQKSSPRTDFQRQPKNNPKTDMQYQQKSSLKTDFQCQQKNSQKTDFRHQQDGSPKTDFSYKQQTLSNIQEDTLNKTDSSFVAGMNTNEYVSDSSCSVWSSDEEGEPSCVESMTKDEEMPASGSLKKSYQNSKTTTIKPTVDPTTSPKQLVNHNEGLSPEYTVFGQQQMSAEVMLEEKPHNTKNVSPGNNRELEQQVKKQEDMIRVLQEQVLSLLKIKEDISTGPQREPYFPLTPASTPEHRDSRLHGKVAASKNVQHDVSSSAVQTESFSEQQEDRSLNPGVATIGVNTGASLLWDNTQATMSTCTRCCTCCRKSDDNVTDLQENRAVSPEKSQSLTDVSEVDVKNDTNESLAVPLEVVDIPSFVDSSSAGQPAGNVNDECNSRMSDEPTCRSDHSSPRADDVSPDVKGKEYYDQLLCKVKDLLSDHIEDDSPQKSGEAMQVVQRSSSASFPTREGVVKATMRELEKMRNSENEGIDSHASMHRSSSSVLSIHQRSLSTSFIPDHLRFNYVSMVGDETFDEMAYVDEIATKYLSDKEIQEYKRNLPEKSFSSSAQSRTVRFGSLPSCDKETRGLSSGNLKEVDFTWNNLSICTKDYLTKYNLVESRISMSVVEQQQQQHSLKPDSRKSPDPGVSVDDPCKPPLPSPATRVSKDKNEILDIKRLKKLPKLF